MASEATHCGARRWCTDPGSETCQWMLPTVGQSDFAKLMAKPVQDVHLLWRIIPPDRAVLEAT